ncbi:unnamed protein product [Brassica rapa]|uniref:Uncharacterized protein n=2 Tax=Brassica TaxID=3705 RepID=A0A3P6CE54_BRACM|nr:unnamed protein product [Brassica napus]CAG7909188.1 unnamed protein product [Brassica rapa]CDY46861.1 BnaA10g03450D [Brassica napus]VDD16957.1 unnamed protein product [Brassica rapa]
MFVQNVSLVTEFCVIYIFQTSIDPSALFGSIWFAWVY